MRISEMLIAIASWLESPDNEALMLAEYDDNCLEVVATACGHAAHLLKSAAEYTDAIEPQEESKITPESIKSLADLADKLDASGDEKLIRQASVIDELLLTIASPPGAADNIRSLQKARLQELKRKYEDVKSTLDSVNKITEAAKDIDKSPIYSKEYRILEAPLSTRYCPDHAGAQITRVGEHVWQCDLDKKIYDFNSGFELNNGSKVPGGDVSNQSDGSGANFVSLFDTREERLLTNRG